MLTLGACTELLFSLDRLGTGESAVAHALD